MNEWLHANLPMLTLLAKGLVTGACVMWAVFFFMVLVKIPMPIKSGGKSIEGPVKFAAAVSVLILSVVAIATVVLLPLLLVAKIFTLLILAGSIIISWALIVSSSQLARLLDNAFEECELATNITLLENDRVQNQLSDICDRLHDLLHPQEMELKEMLLKSAGPILKLVLTRDTNLLKWSIAAGNAFKNVQTYLAHRQKKQGQVTAGG